MIQFRRGKSSSWGQHVLEAGQPGYDKTENKLKIGDGENTWDNLDYLIGELDEKRLIQPATALLATDKTIFTYGSAAPTSKTKGKVYLQQFEGAVEVDYVIEIGRNVNYFFRRWNSGFIECWGKGKKPTNVTKLFKSIIFDVNSNGFFEIRGFWK